MKSPLLSSGMCIPLTSVRKDMALNGNQPCVTLISVRILMSSSFVLIPWASVLFLHRLIHSCRVSWWLYLASDSIILYSFPSIPRYSTENLSRLSAGIISVTFEISSSFNVMMLEATFSEKLKMFFLKKKACCVCYTVYQQIWLQTFWVMASDLFSTETINTINI